MRIIRININKYPLILIFEIKKYSNFYRVIFFRINIHRLSILTKPMFLGDYDLNFRQKWRPSLRQRWPNIRVTVRYNE